MHKLKVEQMLKKKLNSSDKMKNKHLEKNNLKKIKIKTIDHVILTFFFSYVCNLTKVINCLFI